MIESELGKAIAAEGFYQLLFVVGDAPRSRQEAWFRIEFWGWGRLQKGLEVPL